MPTEALSFNNAQAPKAENWECSLVASAHVGPFKREPCRVTRPERGSCCVHQGAPTLRSNSIVHKTLPTVAPRTDHAKGDRLNPHLPSPLFSSPVERRGFAVIADKANSATVRPFLGSVIQRVGTRPHYLICDKGRQLIAERLGLGRQRIPPGNR